MQWSMGVVDVVNGALGVKTNLLFDYLPSLSSSPEALLYNFAGNSNLLTAKLIGQRILFSFVVKVRNSS